MTEQDWLACVDPTPMLGFLRGKAGKRKWRLFGVACCRRLWKLLPPDRRTLLEASERYSDEQSTAGELYDIATRVQSDHANQASNLACEAVRCCADLGDEEGAIALAAYYAGGAAEAIEMEMAAASREKQAQVAFLRDIFSNPFRPIYLNPAWLIPVTNLATAAYEERALPSGELDTARLAVLADALEEAGCQDANILGHLRSPGPHVRGCWPVDLLLGKE